MRYKYAKPAEKRRARPESWITGPDELIHEKYYAWHKHRAQAHYREEEYELTFDQWQEIWKDDEQFLNRGKTRECFVLTRIDPEAAWSMDNCEIITRYEQLCRTTAKRVASRWGSKLDTNDF